jgi:hypothetical protein
MLESELSGQVVHKPLFHATNFIGLFAHFQDSRLRSHAYRH